MKKLLLASLAVLAMGAQAAAPSSPLNHAFTAGLTSFTGDCKAHAGNAAAGSLSFGTYTGFQAAAANATAITSKLICSKDMTAPTVSFTQIAGGQASNGATVTDGIIAGLAYSMTVTAVSTLDGTDSVQASSTAATEDTHSVSIGGSIAGSQPGDVLAAPLTQSRVLVWAF